MSQAGTKGVEIFERKYLFIEYIQYKRQYTYDTKLGFTVNDLEETVEVKRSVILSQISVLYKSDCLQTKVRIAFCIVSRLPTVCIKMVR
jgi:hypothetical protein